MSKVVHPYAHRLVTLRDWKSRWFADKKYKNNAEHIRDDFATHDALKESIVLIEDLIK